MGSKLNLTGRVFGMWTVIEECKNNRQGKNVMWICRCECGIEKEVYGCKLNNGTSKSCGHKESLVGKRYGKLTVISIVEDNSKRDRIWLCECDCGEYKNIPTGSLNCGNSTSCGCGRLDGLLKSITTHGQSKKGKKTPEYVAWCSMKSRCYSKTNGSYDNYGGRGVKVCDRWLSSFENFFEDMGLKPGDEYSLDRYPNNDTGDYEPGNCRWGTDEQQARNKRSNLCFEYDGKKMILADWAKYLGVKFNTIRNHVDKNRPFKDIFQHFKQRNINA